MTTEPLTCPAVIPEKHCSDDQNTSCSALFYLFQEVSKLASTEHNCYLDANSNSRKDLVEYKDEEVVNLSSNKYLKTNLIQRLSCSQEKNMKLDDSRLHVVNPGRSHCESNSPWKVLSLINHQCKRLLHQSDAENIEPGLLSSNDAVIKRALCDPQVKIKGNFDNVIENCTEDGCKSLCCVKVESCVVEEADSHCPLAVMKDSKVVGSLKQQDWFKMDVNSSADRQVEWSQKCRKSMSPTSFLSELSDTQWTPNSYYKCGDQHKSTLTLDNNANLVWPAETQLPYFDANVPAAQTPSIEVKSSENCLLLAKKNENVTACELECSQNSTDAISSSAGQLDLSNSPSSASSTTTVWTQPEKKPNLTPTPLWKANKPRKQPRPCRSSDSQGPDFQGVTFSMDAELDDTGEQCRLHITSKFSKGLCQTPRKPRVKRRLPKKPLKTSSSEEESELMGNDLKVKVCASCCTRKTPMWRDAEDGTPLCNACGIRYKKYRVRCANCWYIPRKESNSNSYCLKCGKCVRLTSGQKKHISKSPTGSTCFSI